MKRVREQRRGPPLIVRPIKMQIHRRPINSKHVACLANVDFVDARRRERRDKAPYLAPPLWAINDPRAVSGKREKSAVGNRESLRHVRSCVQRIVRKKK